MPQKHYRVFFEELINLLNMEDVFKTLQKMSMRSITRKAKKYAKMFPMEPVFIITLEPEDISSVEIAGIQQKSLPSLEKLRTLVSGMNVIRPDHATLLLLRTWNVRSGVNIGEKHARKIMEHIYNNVVSATIFFCQKEPTAT
jgi:hypothetical protein